MTCTKVTPRTTVASRYPMIRATETKQLPEQITTSRRPIGGTTTAARTATVASAVTGKRALRRDRKLRYRNRNAAVTRQETTLGDNLQFVRLPTQAPKPTVAIRSTRLKNPAARLPVFTTPLFTKRNTTPARRGVWLRINSLGRVGTTGKAWRFPRPSCGQGRKARTPGSTAWITNPSARAITDACSASTAGTTNSDHWAAILIRMNKSKPENVGK
mmetsp:Transcript_13552/g.50733  ORF Transcript_13552/g.50733 Transcript_13552/m.50733 type:complete len:216 (+) Transcript_13552:1357-2004(+)